MPITLAFQKSEGTLKRGQTVIVVVSNRGHPAMRIRRRTWVIGALGLVLTLGVLAYGRINYQWFTPVDPVGEMLAAMIASAPATSADWRRVAISTSDVDVGEVKLPVIWATNLRAVLEAEKNMVVYHVLVKSARDSSGALQTTISSHKAGNALVLDQKQHALRRGSRIEDGGLTLDQKPEEMEGKPSYNIFFGENPKNRTKKVICIYLPQSGDYPSLMIPYDYVGYSDLAPYATTEYPIALLPKVEENSGEIAGIMVIDVQNGKLLTELVPPVGARRSRPNFAIDKKNDVLISVGHDVDWLMVFDLQPYMKQRITPAK